MNNSRVLFIGDSSSWSQLANSFLQEHFSNVTSVFWNRGERYPSQVDAWKGDYIFSFKSDLILSKNHIKNTRGYCLNFHPSPPKYRGIGGYNYALYNKDDVFGVTVHHLVEKIDSGKIIKVRYFPIIEFERASSLETRTGAYCLTLFYEIVQLIILSKNLPLADETWGNKLYTHKQLENFIIRHQRKGYVT